MAGGKGEQREIAVELGPALTVRDSSAQHRPLDQMTLSSRVHHTQVYLPIPATTWTALVTGSTAHAAHADLIHRLAVRLAGSLRVTLPPDASET